MEQKQKGKHNAPFIHIRPHSDNFWNRYESWRAHYFQRPSNTSCKAPEKCAICGKTGDQIFSHIQKCNDGIFRCNRCKSSARPDDVWFKFFGYRLYDFPIEPIRIKDETNDVNW